jgi:hypothetical protein
MPDDPAQTFWNCVFAQVQSLVCIRNEELGSHLKFERLSNGFGIRRESPFLLVERWLAENRIHGRSETRDKSGRASYTMFVPLTITGENEASWPADPSTKPEALTTEDVANGTLGFF